MAKNKSDGTDFDVQPPKMTEQQRRYMRIRVQEIVKSKREQIENEETDKVPHEVKVYVGHYHDERKVPLKLALERLGVQDATAKAKQVETIMREAQMGHLRAEHAKKAAEQDNERRVKKLEKHGRTLQDEIMLGDAQDAIEKLAQFESQEF